MDGDFHTVHDVVRIVSGNCRSRGKTAAGKFFAMLMQQRVFLHPNYPGPVAQPDRAAAF